MTGIDIDAIRARAEAATLGPWFQGREGHRYESERDVYSHREPEVNESHDIASSVWSSADAEFIAHAREDVPALLDEVERLRTERDAHRTMKDTYRIERDEARLSLMLNEEGYHAELGEAYDRALLAEAQVQAVRHILSSGYADFSAFQGDLREAVALDSGSDDG